MLSSPGWRARTSQRFTLLIFSAFILVGALTTTLSLWIVSGLLSAMPIGVGGILLAAAALAGALRDWNLVTFSLPENKRLVPKSVFRNRPVRAAAQFGFELGTGVRTYMPATSPYVLALAILFVAHDFYLALLVGGGFAAGRAVVPWLSFTSAQPTEWDHALAARTSWVLRVSSATVLIWAVGLALQSLIV
jgi:hypothetical protein